MQKTHPLNVLRFCPKCGSPDFNIAGERSLKCKSCGFHYYINASAAVAALVTDGNGKLMLVTRGVEPDYGKLDLPGGFVDHFESVEDAVQEMVHFRDEFQPDKSHAEIYGQLYKKVYKKMYKKLEPFYHEIREITGYPE